VLQFRVLLHIGGESMSKKSLLSVTAEMQRHKANPDIPDKPVSGRILLRLNKASAQGWFLPARTR